MKILIKECKKIMDIRVLLVIAVFTVLFYQLFLEVTIYPAGGQTTNSQYDMPFYAELIESWGTSLPREDWSKLDEKRKELEEAYTRIIAADQVLADAKITNYQEVSKTQETFFDKDTLTDEEKNRVCGLIINKFRGDIRLFEPGIKMLEDLCGIPVVGVVPYYRDIYIEEEDSVSLETKNTKAGSGKINVAIVLLKRLSNFTDFSVLERDERFHAYYTNNVEEIGKADIIILPGTKNTISDLRNIRANGIAEAVIRAHKEGKKVIGICGGYQMMGARIEDPDQIEGDMTAIPGLGILPLVTIMEPEKVTRQDQFTFRNHPETCKGYEIHMGRTTLLDGAPEAPLNRLHDGRTDGYILNERCWGSYLHGILDNDIVLNELAEGLTQASPTTFNYTDFKDQQYNKLADHVRTHVDLPYIYSTLKTK